MQCPRESRSITTTRRKRCPTRIGNIIRQRGGSHHRHASVAAEHHGFLAQADTGLADLLWHVHWVLLGVAVTVPERYPQDDERGLRRSYGEIMLRGHEEYRHDDADGASYDCRLRGSPADVGRPRRLAGERDGGRDEAVQVLTSPERLLIVVLFIFLWNLRISLITLTAIPLSIIITAMAFSHFGISMNTMTLGGLAAAIGELVDDSIVDIENIFRRLKENYRKSSPDSPLRVIFLASCEVRNSIVYATLIVVLAVLPLFSLSGLEGRMFAPLGLAYLTTLLASLVVSLTVTPVLASYLLFKKDFVGKQGDPLLLRWLKWVDGYLLRFTLRHSTAVLVTVGVLVVLSHYIHLMVTVHGAAGDCPVFRPKAQPFEYGLTENTGLSPSAAEGGQSHFRGEDARFLTQCRPRRENWDSPL